jgi:hypothetical protein
MQLAASPEGLSSMEYRAYSVSTDNILMWICEVYYTTQRRWFTIDYFLVLFTGDCVKRQPQHIIR